MEKSFLKARLKRIYKKIVYDFQDYDCGHTLLCNMSSEYYNLTVEFNKVADKLSKLDSTCPKFRYKH